MHPETTSTTSHQNQSTNTTKTTHSTRKMATDHCACQCQCPFGAVPPQISGAAINYQYLPIINHTNNRRGRRSDTGYNVFMNEILK